MVGNVKEDVVVELSSEGNVFGLKGRTTKKGFKEQISKLKEMMYDGL